MSVSETTRREVWNEFLDAARLMRYYAELSDRHRRRRQYVQWLLLFLALGGVSHFLDLLPDSADWIAGLTSIGIAAAVAWDFMADDAKKAAVLHSISVECGDIEMQWRELWLAIDQEQTSDEEVRRRFRDLSDRLLRTTSRAGEIEVQEDSRLNEASTKIAYQVMTDRYIVEDK